VVNAASAALFLNTKGHGSTIFRDGLRLVLVIFLLTSALWAQVDFITTIIDPASKTACQIGIIFSTLFDQLARFAIEQFLLWATTTGGRLSVLEVIPQILLLGRFIVGATLVGFSKPQTGTFCVASTTSMPLAIAVISLDVVLILALIARSFNVGRAQGSKSTDSERRRPILLIIIGLAVWTGVS
jgi:hypothetical protein